TPNRIVECSFEEIGQLEADEHVFILVRGTFIRSSQPSKGVQTLFLHNGRKRLSVTLFGEAESFKKGQEIEAFGRVEEKRGCSRFVCYAVKSRK
ncbi:uncharacterized protein NEMAJ01_2410, partial [Nematocida major]|uniref:uncharacterized protein n=1 Tax=Nematocida major TaxID=1912982 RepID=UPI002007A607